MQLSTETHYLMMIALKVAVVPEGAADAVSILGLVRLARYLTSSHNLDGLDTIVVDSGTGTSAIGAHLAPRLFLDSRATCPIKVTVAR